MFEELKQTRPDPPQSVHLASLSGSRLAPLLLKRYTDGYRVAHFIVLLGKFVKAIGLVFAAAVFAIGALAPYFLPSNFPMDFGGNIARMVLVTAVAGLIWLWCFIVGTLISACGHILLAVLDQAVNTSSLVTDEQRAQIMGL